VVDPAGARHSCALRTEDDGVIEVIDSTIRHINAIWRAHLDPFNSMYRSFPSNSLRPVQFHAGDEDGGEIGALGCLQQIRGYIKFVMHGNIYASFVPKRIVGCFDGRHEERVGRRRADALGE